MVLRVNRFIIRSICNISWLIVKLLKNITMSSKSLSMVVFMTVTMILFMSENGNYHRYSTNTHNIHKLNISDVKMIVKLNFTAILQCNFVQRS